MIKFVLGTCFLVVMMDNTILNVALRAVQQDLGATNAELQWAVDSYTLVYAALMFTAGILADRFGRRRVLAIGLTLFAVASAFSAFASTPEQLIGWRAVMAIGGAVVPPATLAIIKQSVAPEAQGKAMAAWAAIGGLSVAFGPIVGGALLESFWWGSVFLINVPVVALCVAALFAFVPESRSTAAFYLDPLGITLSIVSISALVFGVIRAGESNEWLAFDTGGMIALGLLLGAVFVFAESRIAHPAVDVRLFRNRAFAGGTAAVAIGYFSLSGTMFLLVFFIQLVLGHSSLALGLILLPVAIGSVVGAVVAQKLVSIIGYRTTVVAGLTLLACGLGGVGMCTADTALSLLELALLSGGLGMGLVMAGTTALVMSAVADEHAGVGSAVSNTVRQVGFALGVATMGSVLSIGYRAELGSAVDVLPQAMREDAADSLGATMLAASEAKVRVTGAAEAFVSSMQSTMFVGVGVLLFGVALTLVLVPGRAKKAAPAPEPAASTPTLAEA